MRCKPRCTGASPTGLLFQMNYMWSHGITDSSTGAGESVAIQNMACRACDRSSSNIDVRHNLIANAVYELPFARNKRFLGGWELAGIGSAHMPKTEASHKPRPSGTQHTAPGPQATNLRTNGRIEALKR